MSTVRLRRLQSDYERLTRYVTRHPRLQLIQTQGSPPEQYQIEYKIKSLRQKDGQLQETASHLVEIALPREYPRTPPYCRMLTPVFHPNIAPHAICIGDHWSAGESLEALVARIGEMLAYQSYNTKSPLNGEAARWVVQNIDRLPLDAVTMAVEEKDAPGAGTAPPPLPTTRVGSAPIGGTTTAPARSTAPPAAASPPPVARTVACPACAARMKLPPNVGPRVRCPKCKGIITVSDMGPA